MEVNHRQPWSSRHALPLLLLAAVTFLVYSNSFHNGFHLDDVPIILENAQIKDLGNLPQILATPRGLTNATFALNYAIGGLNVFGYHLVNVACHAANAILIYFLLFVTLLTGRHGTDDAVLARARKLSLFAALLFAVHPIQTQAVNYIVQRMELLASFFYLLALLLFIKATATSGLGRRFLLFFLVFASYWVGLYSKEIVITFPLLALVYDYFFLSQGNIRNLIRQRGAVYLVLFLLMFFYAAKTILVLGGVGSATDVAAALPGGENAVGFSVSTMTWWEYLLTQFNVVLYYIFLLLVPTNLNLFYDFPISRGLLEIPQVSEGAVLNYPLPPPLVSLLALSVIVLTALWSYRVAIKSGDAFFKVIAFFIIWFFVILVPTSSIVPIADVIFEHRVYLSAAGYAVVFVLLLERFFTRGEPKPQS